MTDEEYQAVQALNHCTFSIGSYQKRFVRDLGTLKRDHDLTDKQRSYLQTLTWKYRKQIRAKVDADFDFSWTLDSPDVVRMVLNLRQKQNTKR